MFNIKATYVCKLVFVLACALAGLSPAFYAYRRASANEVGVQTKRNESFPGFPSQFNGRALTELPLTELEQRFATDFPGRVGRFTDGEREIIIRWVTDATRQFHPSSDCFQGAGYTVRPLPLHADARGARWSGFTATRGAERVNVRERIYTDAGQSWSDVSAWYWDAALNSDVGQAWWAMTVAERSLD